MRFHCDSCGAKYKIADEKVSGRLLRFPCRKCDNKILINGKGLMSAEPVAAAGGAAPASSSVARTSAAPRPTARSSRPSPSRIRSSDPDRSGRHPGLAPNLPSPQPSLVPAATGRAIWHVSIKDAPVGPMTVEELSHKVDGGAVSEYSLVWQQSFDEWRPLATVPELMSLLQRRRASVAPRGTFTSIPPAEEVRESQLPSSPPAPPPSQFPPASEPRSGLASQPPSGFASEPAASGFLQPTTSQFQRPSDPFAGEEPTVVSPLSGASSQRPSQTGRNSLFSQPPINDLAGAPPSAGSHPGAAYAQSSAGSYPGAAYSQPSAGSHPGAAYSQPSATGSYPGAAYSQPPATGSYPGAAYSQPPGAGSYPGAAYSQPPTHGSQPGFRPSQPGMFPPSSPGFGSGPHSLSQPHMAPIGSQPTTGHSGSFPGFVPGSSVSGYPSQPGMPAPMIAGMPASVSGLPAPVMAPQAGVAVPVREERGIPNWIIVLLLLLTFGLAAFAVLYVLERGRISQSIRAPVVQPVPQAERSVAPPAVEPTASTTEEPTPAPTTRIEQELEPAPTPQRTTTKKSTASSKRSGTKKAESSSSGIKKLDSTKREEDELLKKFGGSGAGPAKIDTSAKRSSSSNRKQLDAAAVRQTVAKNRTGLQRCYERSLRGQPMESAIRVDVVVNVGRSGKVTSARASARGPAPGGLTQCVESRVKRWKFPATSNGGPAKFPVVFQPKG